MNEAPCNLTSCFLCSGCIPEWKEVIAVKKQTLAFKKGELIFKEGDPVNGIYFLYAGAVKVHKQWVEQKELILRFSRPGDILGHRGLAAGDVYPVSATALVESQACFISNSFLETTLRADHGFTYRLMQLYSSELQKAEMRMRNLALMEVKGRIAETLLTILDVFGTNAEGYMTVPVTRQDISAYAGTTYETVFKLLTSLTNDKIIAASGKSIRINDEQQLRKMVTHAK
jgi:CRP-like cAMP-binding protein